MRFCTTCGSPVSGILRFCTRCGAATSSTAGAEVASVAATGTVDPGPAEAGLAEAGPVEAGPAEAGPGPADTTTLTGTPGPGTRSAEAPAAPAIPAQAGMTDAESGDVPPDHCGPAEAAAPGPAPQHSPALAVPPTGKPEDAGPLGLVRIDAEPTPEASPEDPWLPGSRRPDRRALIIGVVLIAGLLSVASTAWLIRVNSPQASSPHGAHRSRPTQLGPGNAQPGQALSGQPTPILIQRSQPAPGQLQPSQPAPSQPAPTQTGNGPAGPGRGPAR